MVRRLGSVLLAAAALLVGCGGDEPVELVAPTGYGVALEHEEAQADRAAGAFVDWRSSWRLTWEPVEGARSYAVHYGTSEGVPGGPPARTEPEPAVEVEAAAGTSPPERLDQDRAAGLLFTSSQLLVSVAAVSADGTEGPRSPWFPVGDVPPGGVPIGTAPPDVLPD